MTPEAQREIEKNQQLLDLLKAGAETAFSTIGNAFFDVGSWGATAVENPWKAVQGFGNKSVADEFANLYRERRSQLPELGVTPSTEKIQDAFMSPIKETAGNVWGKAQEAAPNFTETLVEYFNDPRVMHTFKAAGIATPAFARVGAGVRGATILDNLKGNRTGKQKGFILPAEEAIKRADAAGETDLATKLAVNYQAALQMLDQGASPEAISKMTEFHPIPDKNGNYQFVWEVTGKTEPTGKAPYIGNAENPTVPDYYDNPLLYKLVPELKDTKVAIDDWKDPRTGSFNRSSDTITLGANPAASIFIPNAAGERFDVGIHEMAHKGQEIFDMSRGGSSREFQSGSNAPPQDYSEMIAPPLQEIAYELLQGTRPKDILKTHWLPDEKVANTLKDLQEAFDDVGATPNRMSEGMKKRAAQYFIRDTSTDWNRYRSLAGEASANADMKRNYMTDQQRLEYPYAQNMADEAGVIDPRLLLHKDTGGNVSYKEIEDSLQFPNKQKGAINLLSGEGIDVKPYGTNSTRIMTASQAFKQDIEPHSRGDLLVDSTLLDPEKRKQLADIYRSYPALKNIDPLDTEAALSESVDFMSGNLDDIIQLMPDKWRDKSMDWYNGYNRIAQDAAKNHNVSPEQAGSIIAVLSPQTDWNVNLSRADRIMDTWNTRQDFPFSPEMEAQMPILNKSIGLERFKDKLPNIAMKNPDGSGKTLAQMNGSEEKAMWIRAYDQAHNPREFHIYEPDGKKGRIATKKDGSPRESNWASTNTIEKAVKILEDGSPENISHQLGGEHKVRSFARNAADPNELTTTTMDTHAIATALMQPLSGNKPKDLSLPYYSEVPQNFGAGMSDAKTGMSGTYPINQDAYNKVAQKYGVTGREIQSPTWEFGREMMNNQKTPAMKRYADDVWKKYADGKLTREQAFDLIVKAFGVPSQPK